MAYSNDVVWEVRIGGDDSNGGGYRSGGTDYSQQTTPQAILTTASTVNATTSRIDVASGDYTVSAGDIGNILQISGGTATAGWYLITAVDTVNNRWTLDRAVGTSGQTVAGKMGGCLASIGVLALCTSSIPGSRVWIKDDGSDFVLSTSTPNVSGGPLTINRGLYLEGYQTTRGDRASRPRINAGALTGISMFAMGNNSGGIACNLTFDGNNGASNFGVRTNNGTNVYFCTFENLATGCAGTDNSIQSGFVVASKAYNCTIGFGVVSKPVACWADACGTGFAVPAVNCLATNCTGTGFSGGYNYGCTAYGCVDGITGLAASCLSVGNSGYGYKSRLIGCASYNNTSGRWNGTNPFDDINPIILTGDPFINAAAGDFSLNNNSGAGASCRAAGIPPFGQTGYPDVGSVQHQDGSGTPQVFTKAYASIG